MSVVLVTGAGGGMGAAHARLLAGRGSRVACLDVDAAAARRTAEACGPSAVGLGADVRDQASLDDATRAVLERWGRLDGVVANAGVTVSAPRPLWEGDPDDWARVLDVNLAGVWRTVRATVPALAASGGSLVLISSVAGLSGAAGWGPYVAAKHGVVGLMRTLVNELAGTGVRCNAVCPGMVRTPMLEADRELLGVAPDDMEREFAAGHLDRRLLEPEEVAEVVAFLLSRASRAINGVALPVDLGYLARTPGT